MRIIIKDNYEEVCDWVSTYIKIRINNANKVNIANDIKHKNNNFVLGLPTGSSPIGVYKNLVKFCKNGKLSFKNTTTFNMDEYVGIPENHPESYHYFMYQNLFNHIDINPDNINILDGNTEDLNRECRNYESKIELSGGIDLFLGGLGADGHIAFNEPGSSLNSRTRIKTLCSQTIVDNSRFFNNISEVPTTALTVGVGTILDAKEIVLIVSGHKKALALYKCIEEGINHMWTMSALQQHPKVTIVCDKDAISELKCKTVSYFKQLQNTTDIMGNPITSNINKILPTDKVIIFSPHPDDDVIGIGGTMKLLPNKDNVTIIYMTSGSGGLPKELPQNTRQKEAELAVKILGYQKENIIFLDMPFYKLKKEPGNLDIDIIKTIDKKIKPDHIFICGDPDPNGTHKKCYQTIYETYESLKKDYNCDVNTESGLAKRGKMPEFWIYKGAWNVWDTISPKKPNCYVHIPKNIYEAKKHSILAHQSQDPPVVTNNDKRTFLQRAIESNKDELIPGEYIEKMLKLNTDDFLELGYTIFNK